ncbi:superoxide dismutase family protein [Streptomonospora wellingtoniae]|uniref:Superoxide dismutase family protein n=1 Tax=Streptomonospora wellingtoniae TaxID=3075544 RepID=A0ABU2KYW6_9ACTN|nr:superoxide dismutase family protein [Streptomonospora sp. DSM 45055]MDT0304437.1 superoxide dismutase family protein [Streptomonospora sp. DSM 45055]
MSVTRAIFGLAAASLLTTGYGTPEGDAGGAAEPSFSAGRTAEAGGPGLARFGGEFTAYSPRAAAVTYDGQAVPTGSTVSVSAVQHPAGTDFTLAVSGLQPEETYGAHLHTQPCGRKPADAGPHYQDEPAPPKSSHDPEYVNDDNEVWLDFTTDSDGAATTAADVEWQPREGEADSIVIHSDHTQTAPGEAGAAGTRLACVNAPL